MRASSAVLGDVLVERRTAPNPESVVARDIPLVAKVDFDGGIHLREGGDTKTKLILVEPGDLLVSGINGAKGAIGWHQPGGHPVAATIHYSAYEVQKDVAVPLYLWWLLRSDAFRHILLRHSPGGIKAELRARRLLALPIPLPSISDQRRLVVFFAHAEQLARRAREMAGQAVNRADRLLVSCIDDAMDRLPVEGQLDDVLTLKPRAGPSFPTDRDWQGTPVLMPSSVTGFNVDPTKCEYGLGDMDVNEKDRLQPGDVLIARGNKRDQVGNAGVVPVSCRGWVCANLLMRTVVDPNRTLPEFLVYWLRGTRMRHIVAQATHGTSPSIQKINQRSILAFPYPSTVPLARQEAIVGYLQDVEDRATRLLNGQRELAASAARTLASVVTAALEQQETRGADQPPGSIFPSFLSTLPPNDNVTQDKAVASVRYAPIAAMTAPAAATAPPIAPVQASGSLMANGLPAAGVESMRIQQTTVAATTSLSMRTRGSKVNAGHPGC